MGIFKRIIRVLRNEIVSKKLFLIAKARASGEGDSDGFNRYTGVGKFTVLAVNPNKEELSELYGRVIENDPIYIYPPMKEGDPKSVAVSFIIKTVDDPINSDKEYVGPIRFMLRNSFSTSNKDGVEKVKVIDNYGQTSWVTEEQLKKQTRPLQRNGKQAKIIPPFRPMYQGEEQLVNFLSVYLNVEKPMNYTNDEWIPIDNLEDAAISLEGINHYFDGDLTELKVAIDTLKKEGLNNTIKALMYVKTNDDNKSYQQVYTDVVLKPNSSNYAAFEKSVNERKEIGGLNGCTFTYGPLQDFQITPTSFSEVKEEATVGGWFKK